MGESEEYLGEYRLALAKFLKDIAGENVLQIVLRSHLYIENALERLLKEALENPELIVTPRFMFMNKLSLARAMGLIPHGMNVLLKYFNNDIRNKYAHNLEFEMTEEHLMQLISRFDGRTKKMYDDFVPYLVRGETEFQDFLNHLGLVLGIMWCNVTLCHIEYNKKPLQEELESLKRMREFALKTEEEQIEYFVDAKKKLREKIVNLEYVKM